ncbi:MAG: hypothetical protein WCC42_14745, partial [Pseudolabrys sp.]
AEVDAIPNASLPFLHNPLNIVDTADTSFFERSVLVLFDSVVVIFPESSLWDLPGRWLARSA